MVKPSPAASIPQAHKILRTILIALLVLFSVASVAFSLFVLFTDLGKKPEISSAQARGLFTVFIYDYIDEVHPQKPSAGHSWTIDQLDFPNKNFARVTASDGLLRSKLEFIYVVEYPNVRILKINDITGRDLEDANVAVIRFLTFMQNGDYANAAVLYAGPISRLVPYGGPNSPLPVLLEGYCTQTSPAKKCLPFHINESSRDPISGEYRFIVNYELPDTTQLTLPNGKTDFVMAAKVMEDGFYKITALPFD
ncbi:MAG: hypothetical protein HY422_03000 [Candidatus Komeilibacteria bacterium]|nr:hypothetical protein [Candidatus Komeilibacteria bacterium]